MNDILIKPGTTVLCTIEPACVATRIDAFLSNYFTKYSRNYFKKLIDDGHITINGTAVKKPSLLIKQQDHIEVHFPCEKSKITVKNIDSLPVSIVYEHEHFLVVNKPPFLSVHAPHKNNQDPSLVDWLLSKFEEIRLVGNNDRPGIVHRLDKNTSGLLLISRNNYSHEVLSNLFKNRLIKKTYRAVVTGHPPQTGTIDFPIMRDPFVRTKMSHSISMGRPAVTHYKVIEYFDNASLLELYPLTGRTHQIRVHCAAIGHPIIGDTVYGGTSKIIKRHALHALSLDFSFEEQSFSFCQDLPQDFNDLLDSLRVQ